MALVNALRSFTSDSSRRSAAGYLVEDFYRLEKQGRSYGAYLLSADKKLIDII
jgi:hypothetical protein